MAQKTETVPNTWAQRMVGAPGFPPRHAMAALRVAGLREAYVMRPDGRIRLGDEIALITHLCRDRGGALAAARAAARTAWRPAGPVADAFGACRDRADALRFLVRHAALLRPCNPLHAGASEGLVALDIPAPPSALPATPEWLAWSVAAAVRQVQAIFGPEAPALRLRLGPEVPVDPVAFGAILGLPCSGDPERSGLVLLAEVPVPESGLRTRRLAESLLTPDTRLGPLGDVAAALLAALPFGRGGPAELAQACGQSGARLRSRLASEGLTFRDLTERVRQEALRPLRRCPDLARAEIAFLLGFATEQAFAAYLRRSGLFGRESETARDHPDPRPGPDPSWSGRERERSGSPAPAPRPRHATARPVLPHRSDREGPPAAPRPAPPVAPASAGLNRPSVTS